MHQRLPRSREPVESPSCPECGCNQADLVNAGMRWGRAWALFACDHCGAEFGLGRRPENTTNGHAYRVPFPKLKCPSCDSKRTKTRSSPATDDKTRLKMRYHQCLDCGCDFSSYEEE